MREEKDFASDLEDLRKVANDSEIVVISSDFAKYLLRQTERVQRLEKVLEFYADKQNYKRPKTDLREASMSEIMKDYGERARKELEGGE